MNYDEPLQRGDDVLLLQMLHAVCARVDQLLTQGMVIDESETVDRTQQKIDRLKLDHPDQQLAAYPGPVRVMGELG